MPVERDDVLRLAVDLDRVGEVVRVRARCARCASRRPARAGRARRSAGTAPPNASATLLRRSRRQASCVRADPGRRVVLGGPPRIPSENSVPGVVGGCHGVVESCPAAARLGAPRAGRRRPATSAVSEVQSVPYSGLNTIAPKSILFEVNFGSCLLAVGHHVGLLGGVRRRAPATAAATVSSLSAGTALSCQLALDLRVVDLAEVLVVGRLDRVLVQQQVEVATGSGSPGSSRRSRSAGSASGCRSSGSTARRR